MTDLNALADYIVSRMTAARNSMASAMMEVMAEDWERQEKRKRKRRGYHGPHPRMKRQRQRLQDGPKDWRHLPATVTIPEMRP